MVCYGIFWGGQLAKRNFSRAAYFFCTFLCRCFARLPRETSRNFLFSLPLIFTLMSASISYFPTGATNFNVLPTTKKNCLLCLLSLALVFSSLACRLLSLFPLILKGDVTRDDLQRRFLTQHIIATLLRHCFEWLHHCSNIATLCCTRNRRRESSRVTSPLDNTDTETICAFRFRPY